MLLGVLVLLDIWLINGGCVDYCGRQADTGCWCDPSCKKTGDCCLDFISACPEYQPKTSTDRAVSPTSKSSQCINNCGGKAATGCWCEPGCAAHGDCCSDLLVACPQYVNSLAYPGKTTCLGMCGNHTAFCWCDGGCIAKGDCCDDFNQICLQSAQAKLLSCAGHCGGAHPTGSCNCDSTCITAADCCPDFTFVCSANNAGPSPAPTNPTFTNAQAELDKNKLIWQNAGLAMYRFHYKHTCDICPASYSGEKIVTYSTSQGVVGITDVDTRGSVPVDMFSDYKLIPDLWDLIQAAINEKVPLLTVGYDTTYGFPVMVNIRWNAKENDYVFITGFENLDTVLQGCLPNLRACPDGSSLPRDPQANCTFKLCPTVKNADNVTVDPNPVLSICSSRVASLGFCFMREGIPSDPQTGPSCIEYYNTHIAKWSSSQTAAFGDCVLNERLCETSIEACLLTRGLAVMQSQLDQAKALWDSAQYQVYAVTYQSLCTTCPKSQQSPKIITVNLQQGITGILDSASGSATPVSEWPSYPTVAGVFGFIDQAIKERVQGIQVTYDLQQNGLPTSFALDWASGTRPAQNRPTSARLSGVTNLALGVSDCSKEVRICPDGTLSSRNPRNQCEFDECSLGLGSMKEANEWCLIRNNRSGYCWMENSNPAPLNDPVGACVDYYTSQVNYWLPAERAAFKSCALSTALCQSTIESCIEGRTSLQEDLANNIAKWQARGLQYYQLISQQTCGGCLFQGQVRLTVQQGIGVAKAVTLTQDAIPPQLWVSFKPVDAVFALIQSALNASASTILVSFDTAFGFPASLSINWSPESSPANMTTLEISSLTDLGTAPSRCPMDTRRCADGSVLVRDQFVECEFPPCPLGRGVYNQAAALCNHRTAAGGWCWMQAPEARPGQGVAADQCVAYFTARSAQWNDDELGAFTKCASSNKLCDQTIEACMYRLGEFAGNVRAKKVEWEALQLERYQYYYDQECPACTPADRATKLVTVQNNAVTSVFDIAQRLNLPAAQWKNYKTIEQLYELIEAGLSSASDVVVDFDSNFPIPRQVMIDVKANSKGDEITITTSQFTNLDLNAAATPTGLTRANATSAPTLAPSVPPSRLAPSLPSKNIVSASEALPRSASFSVLPTASSASRPPAAIATPDVQNLTPLSNNPSAPVIPAYSLYLASLFASSPILPTSVAPSRPASPSSQPPLRSLRECPPTTRLCPDGSTQARDPTLECLFPPCPNCPTDTFLCPDGSAIGRKPEIQCQFPPCTWQSRGSSGSSQTSSGALLFTIQLPMRTNPAPTAPPSMSLLPKSMAPSKDPISVAANSKNSTQSPAILSSPSTAHMTGGPATLSTNTSSSAGGTGENADATVQAICELRSTQREWCWQSVGDDANCWEYYINNRYLWADAEVLAFIICAQGYSLCKNPVEACMWKQLDPGAP